MSGASACSVARTELENLAIPDDPDVPEHKKFYSQSQVRQFLCIPRILQVIRCECQRCIHTRIALGMQAKTLKRIQSDFIDKLYQGQPLILEYTLVLGTLLYTDYPALIYGFLENKCSDKVIEKRLQEFTTEHIQRTCWPKLSHSDPLLSNTIANRFRWSKYKFWVPTISDAEFSRYSEHVILPFIHEKKLGRREPDGTIVSEGAHGEVFSFQILDEYRGFQSLPHLRKFARKVLRSNDDPRMFQAEQENLDRVKRIQDHHLVQIIKAFKHGNVGNLIFPLARTNLGAYIRDPSYKALDKSHHTIKMHPFWGQILGVARALHKILDYEAMDATRNEILYGYHLDLKPGNILVDDDGTFIISDFGQAYFKKLSEATSSKVRGFGGTETYAPPEIDTISTVQNRRYDVWSLGCIFLEVCAFVVHGYAGVTSLDAARRCKGLSSNMTDDRFFAREGPTSWRLKAEVCHFMDCLPKAVRESSSNQFIQRIVSCIRGMLKVDVNDRMTSKEVCIELSAILSSREPGLNEIAASDHPILQPPIDGIELGAKAIARTSRLMYNVTGYWSSGLIKLKERQGRIDLLMWENESWHTVTIGQRSHLKMVPRYALHDEGHHRYADASLYIQSALPSKKGSKILNEKFWSDSVLDILLLQEGLLGQRTIRSFAIREAFLLHCSSRSQKYQQRTSTMNFSRAQERAKTVQLWVEISMNEATDVAPKATIALSRRIVIFYASFILIIKLAKNFRVKASTDSKCASSVEFECTDRRADALLYGLALKKEEGDISPGIPLDKKTIEWKEDHESLGLSSVEMTFNNPEDASAFRDAYRKIKYQYLQEMKQMENWKHDVGPEVGYAPNTL